MKKTIFNFKSIILLSFIFIFSACSDEQEIVVDNKSYNSKIEKITPSSYMVGDTIEVFGKNFGEVQADNVLVFMGNDISDDGYAEVDEVGYLSWEDNLIKIIVPEGAIVGQVYITNRISNGYRFEVQQSLFTYLIDLFVKLSLGITVIFIYLQINKIWKRKHEQEVADSQSLTGYFIFVMNCMLWVVYYMFVEEDLNSTIDTSIYIFQGSIFFLIGTGIFVRGRRKEGFWMLVRRALKLERKEADYLLKKWFKPQNAEAIIHILHQIAMIDEEFDKKEQEIIQTFAKEWNIEYNWKKLEAERKADKENSYMRLRKSLESYLFREPPDEQVAQLKDMITTMIEADDKVTEEEELISSELIPMIEQFLKVNKDLHEYRVLIVPQNNEQEKSILELLPQAKKIQTSGGEAYAIGTYYSQKYAEMMCHEYRDIQFFTIVNTPLTNET